MNEGKAKMLGGNRRGDTGGDPVGWKIVSIANDGSVLCQSPSGARRRYWFMDCEDAEKPEGKASHQHSLHEPKDADMPDSYVWCEEYGWAAISDRLPDLDQPVVLFDAKDGNKWIGCRSHCPDADGWVWCNSYGQVWGSGDGWDCESHWDDEYTPTHWHPLPKSPRG